MTMTDAVVDLSRLQFALTAYYHFLFVPLTLGLSVLLGVMESVYVMTRRPIWKELTQFWGLLFGINFAMGVATGITMEFQFGMNWAHFSYYVGDVFGTPLAIEGLMAFFLEGTFVGLFFFGWDRLSRPAHLAVTWLVALGSNISALWILIANGWMQNPVGARFNPETMRMEVSSFYDVMFNPTAQAKFVHTVSAGYVTGAVFVLAVSAFYLLRGRCTDFAIRSVRVAASFGLLASVSVVVLGDESGYVATENQKMKIAAMEAMWKTEPAPASFTLFGLPNMKTRTTEHEIKIPWALGLIATRSLHEQIPGIEELVERAKSRIRNGLGAYKALAALRGNPADDAAKSAVMAQSSDLGYALLLKKIRPDIENATEQDMAAAADLTVPNVPLIFWSFRVMVVLGFYFIALFAVAFWCSVRHAIPSNRWFLRLALFTLPLPWIASELGWTVAENGRQPWAIEGVLPTFLGVSHISVGQIGLTLGGFVLFYSALAIADVLLMVKYARLGPDRYFQLQGGDKSAKQEAGHASSV
jgi:cytochrome bd ubiquinol oxidase subunit I